MKSRIMHASLPTVGALVLLAACKSWSATAKCTDIERYHSNVGILNLPHFSAGTVLQFGEVDGKKVATTLGRLNTEGHMKPGAQFETLEAGLESVLEVSFSADVPMTVQAETKTRIMEGSQLLLTKSMRKDIDNAVALLTNDTQMKTEVLNAAKAAPDSKFGIVSGVITSASAEVRLKSATSVTGNVSIVNTGSGKLSVTYQCDGFAKYTGNASEGFFKTMTLKVDPDAGTIQSVLDPIPVWEYDLNQTLQ